MREKILHLVLALFLASGSGTANAITLLDAPSCMEYVMNFGGNFDDINNKKWLLGFLSGLAFNSGRDVLKSADYYSIYHQVYIYCKEYEDASLDEAAEVIFNKSSQNPSGGDTPDKSPRQHHDTHKQ